MMDKGDCNGILCKAHFDVIFMYSMKLISSTDAQYAVLGLQRQGAF